VKVEKTFGTLNPVATTSEPTIVTYSGCFCLVIVTGNCTQVMSVSPEASSQQKEDNFLSVGL